MEKKKNSIKIFTWLACLVLVAALGVFIIHSSGKKEPATAGGYAKELNLYIWSEFIPDTTIKAFEAKYGIKVNQTFYASMDEMMSKLSTGAYKNYDLIQPYDSEVPALISEGMIQKIDYNNIPNLKYIDKKYLNQEFDRKQKYTLPYVAGSIYIAYNKKTCPIAITKFSDLADPALKNSIVCITSSREIMGIALDSLGYDPNTTNKKEIAKAGALLNSIKPNIKVFDGDSPRKELLNGECSVAITYSQDFAMAQQKTPNDYAIADIQSGYFEDMAQFCVTKGAKHKKEAELFINFIQEPKVMADILNIYPNACVNTEALKYTSETYNKYNGFDLPGKQPDKLWLLKDVGDASAVYDKYWSEFMNK
jgi:spermidine/putrescine-binding protein